MHDELGVLTSCNTVAASSRHVRIDDDAVESLAVSLIQEQADPVWDASLHYRADGENADERTAMWILVLDALNFCFWGQGPDPAKRWRVEWNGELVDGYVALVAALTRAVEAGYRLDSARWLANVDPADVATMLAPAEGHTEIPLMPSRVEHLRELGRGLLPYGDQPATAFIRNAGGSAVALVRRVVETFPSFNDAFVWQYGTTGLPGDEVRFYKRAQILVGDLAGGLAGSDLAQFRDLNQLTAFADYKVPQILRELGVMVYDDHLARLVDSRTHLASGSREELEIRAATVIACDRIVHALSRLGRVIIAAELDWLLWSESQAMPSDARPYHLTPTVFY